MIQNVSGFGYTQDRQYKLNRTALSSLNMNMISFTGLSLPSQYKTSFDYLAAKVLDSGIKKYPVDGSMLSASKIREAMDRIFKLNRVFGPYLESNPLKIAWKNYIPEDVRIYCTDKINEARAGRLKQWQTFLENPVEIDGLGNYKDLVTDIRSDKSLKFVIWNAINSELKVSNRHIPVPFDLAALDETVRHFKNIEPKFRAVTCTPSAFLKMYTHRLRDNLLMKKNLSDNKAVWVRIPSLKKDPLHAEENIASLEILSNKNWCTRSSLDKAKDALLDGDFYIYLQRDEENIWHSIIGMASSRGKIDQIQGRENNNLLPLNELENIKDFIKENNLACQSGVCEEGPKALQQILIADTLLKIDNNIGKSLQKAIRDKDAINILRITKHDVKFTPEGNFIIDEYKPQYLLDSKSGIVTPYSFLGIDEDLVLGNVEVINGDLVLFNKNKIFNSRITKFPEKLRSVKGRIVCSKEQYEKFKDDMLAVVQNSSQIVVR